MYPKRANPRTPFLCSALALILFVAQALADAPERFKVGLILPLSGVTADYGEAMRNSIELARAEHSQLLRHVDFIYEDAQYDAQLAVRAFHKLRERDRVDLVYIWGVAFCRALAPLAERYELPTVGQCVDEQSSRGRRYFIRFQNGSEQYAQAAIHFLASRNAKRIGVFVTDNSYLESFLEALERGKTPGQELVLIERYQAGQMDFRMGITKARRGNYDAIAVLLGPGQIASFYKQLREQRYAPLTIGTNLQESGSEVRAARGALDGSYFVGHRVNPDFVHRYRARYGNESQLSFGALAFDFTIHIGELLAHIRTAAPQGPDILTALTEMGSHADGAAGEYRFRDSEREGRFFEFVLGVRSIEGDRYIDATPPTFAKLAP